MSKRNLALIAVLTVAVLLVAPGCVTKKKYRKDVEEQTTRVDSVESGVEANEKRIGDLKSETDSRLAALDSKTEKAVEVGNTALNKAETAEAAAEKAARGKLLWTVTLTDDRVRFSFGQAALPDEAEADLAELSQRIKSYGKALYLEIEGHTDAAGDEAYNYELGQKRATAVRNYLNEKGGLPLHAMNVISFGESRPVADNSTREGRAQNRRVVVRVLE